MSLVHACVVDVSGKGLVIKGVRGASVAPPYGVLRGHALSHFSASVKASLQSQGDWGEESFGLFGDALSCQEFFSLGESLVWRKAVSRMAAPRGPAVDHR